MPETTARNSAMVITAQELRVQILTSAASLAFSMILSFPILCVKSGLSPLNRVNHPGIQGLNDRMPRVSGVPSGNALACGGAQPLAQLLGAVEHFWENATMQR